MLKRPTSRRKTKAAGVTLNLIPILDAMMTLIAFMLFTMSFLAIVSVESPFPTASRQDNQQKLKERPLQLTLSVRVKDVEIWSPFEKIRPKTIPHLPEGTVDTKSIHEALLGVKQQFPTENQIVLAPHAQANYDTLIAVMDSVRMMEPTDPPLYLKNPTTGVDEAVKILFPNVVFGNLLGDS